MTQSSRPKPPANPLSALANGTLFWVPLAALPILTNLRLDFFTDETVKPKWAGFLLTLLAVGLALTAKITLTVLQKPEKNLSASLPKLPILIGFILLAISAAGIPASINWAEGINRFSYWLGSFWILGAVGLCTLHTPERSAHWLRCSLTLTGTLISALFWKIFLVDYKDPHYDRLVNFSSVGHFNFTADVLVFLIPLLVWVISSTQSATIRAAASLSLLTGLFMLMTSGSLGAMGGLGLGGIATLTLFLLRRGKIESRSSLYRKIAQLTAAILLFGGLTFWGWDKIPENYRSSMFSRATWWKAPIATDTKSDNESSPPLADLWLQMAPLLGARTPMWAAASGMALERPWLGFGTGSFMYEYTAFEKRYTRFFDDETRGHFIRTNPHNVFLQIAVENGIPAAILFHLMFFWLLFCIFKKIIEQPHSLWLCGFWLTIAAFVDAQFNQVFFNPASILLAAISFGFLSGNLAGQDTDRSRSKAPARTLFLFVAAIILLTTLSTTFFAARWLISDHYVATARKLEQSGTTKLSPIFDAWASAYEWSPKNPEALYGLAGFYFARADNWKAELVIEEFLKLAPNQSNALNFAAAIKSALKKYDEAEDLLTRAITFEPDSPIAQKNLDAVRKSRANQENKDSNP